MPVWRTNFCDQFLSVLEVDEDAIALLGDEKVIDVENVILRFGRRHNKQFRTHLAGKKLTITRTA